MIYHFYIYFYIYTQFHVTLLTIADLDTFKQKKRKNFLADSIDDVIMTSEWL